MLRVFCECEIRVLSARWTWTCLASETGGFLPRLKSQVMRKYMNFNNESRLAVTQPEVVSFVMQKTNELAGGISEVSSLMETLGKLIMLNSFAVSSNPDMTWAVALLQVFGAPLIVGLLFMFFFFQPLLGKTIPNDYEKTWNHHSGSLPLLATRYALPEVQHSLASACPSICIIEKKVKKTPGKKQNRKTFLFLVIDG